MGGNGAVAASVVAVGAAFVVPEFVVVVVLVFREEPRYCCRCRCTTRRRKDIPLGVPTTTVLLCQAVFRDSPYTGAVVACRRCNDDDKNHRGDNDDDDAVVKERNSTDCSIFWNLFLKRRTKQNCTVLQ